VIAIFCPQLLKIVPLEHVYVVVNNNIIIRGHFTLLYINLFEIFQDGFLLISDMIFH